MRRGSCLGAGSATPWQTYRAGLLTNLLNPKVALFFLAFLPQFVAPSADSRALAFLFLGAVFVTTGTIRRLALAWFGSTISHRLRCQSSIRSALEPAAGAMFAGFGVKLGVNDERGHNPGRL
jgi:threonine/homoserine/homoserine lactone efflux protein